MNKLTKEEKQKLYNVTNMARRFPKKKRKVVESKISIEIRKLQEHDKNINV